MASTPSKNPFDPPNYDDDRGIRRLISNLRKAITHFENAYHEAQETENVEQQGLANRMRLDMISLYDELLLHNAADSCVVLHSSRKDVLERATSVMARCPSFAEAVLSGPRLSPPLASTISVPNTPEPPRMNSNTEPFTYSLSHLIGQLQTSCLSYEIATDPNMNEDPGHVDSMRKSLMLHRRDLDVSIMKFHVARHQLQSDAHLYYLERICLKNQYSLSLMLICHGPLGRHSLNFLLSR